MRIIRREVEQACKILLRHEVTIDEQLRGRLRQLDLRGAFRKRVLEVHPDRAKTLGQSEETLSVRFQAVNEAYRLLKSIETSREPLQLTTPAPVRAAVKTPPKRRWSIRRPQARPQPEHTADHRHCGALPPRSLRLGEYLYFSGQVTWKQLGAAVLWQRGQRPAVGQLAIRWGYLSERKVSQILARRSRDGAEHEPFTWYAFRRGYLTAFQRGAILRSQRSMQRPLGEFFLREGILGRSHLELSLLGQAQHNAVAA